MSYEAEKAVIGCMLLDEVDVNLSPEMFTDALLGRIFYEIKKAGKVDAILLRSRISADDFPDDVFYRLLNECGMLVTTSVEVDKYADVVRADYIKREIANVVTPDASIEDIIRRLESLDTGKRKEVTAKTLVEEYSGKKFVEDHDIGYDLGFDKLDDIVGGVFKGDMMVVGARPSVGKSAFAVESMLNLAKKNVKVIMFSLEMTNEQLYDRILAHESGIGLSRIKRATSFIGQEDILFDNANKAIEELGDRMVFFDDIYSVSEMRKAAKGFDVVIIDYAQLIHTSGSYKGNRYAEVGQISHDIKQMAKDLNVAVILLAQLNRVSESTSTKEPTMAELREGGDLEQDASQVILLWNKTEDRKTKGMKVDKNRQGEVGQVQMFFDGGVNRFLHCDVDDNPFV